MAKLKKKLFLMLAKLFIQGFGSSVRFPFVHNPTPVLNLETVSVGSPDDTLPEGRFALLEGV